ncbi:MAG: 4-hydroxy-tetrahydrodipicolinate reductase [Oscillospiraceae bacterium]|nr:4-hydroxy-tetrahydrodipicolinate reductase [Oscillospiraceae bacterium]
MIHIVISGCNGRMGKVITELCAQEEALQVVAGIDLNPVKLSTFPVYADPMEFTGKADVVIDFSSPKALGSLLTFCKAKKAGLVLATTGISDEQMEQVREAAKEIAIFKSANMSLGINVLLELVKNAARVLGGSCDIEIVERHHNKKVDAPSGTALMIADAAAGAVDYAAEYVYDRHTVRQPRRKTEIGISAVRGGTIVGEHEILFAGRDEMIEIKHTALSREVFASGAVKAAEFLARQKQPGIYDMSNLVQEGVHS